MSQDRDLWSSQMKRTIRSRRYAECFSIAVLAGAFLISSELPLLASPPQSTASNTDGQKDAGALPETPQPQSAQTPQGQQPAPAPSGAAGAKAATVKGGPVAQPAGAAVAPARQHGHRSLLIKLGLLAAGGIAIGSAVALSESSPSRPPGASSSSSASLIGRR
jgi:nucleoid-associated protein YgaU